jgi:hypothetical protein
VHVTQVAGEGEAYLGRFTVQGIAGVEFGNSVSNTTFGFGVIPPVGGLPGVNTVNAFTEGYDVRTRFFDQINLKYYFTDNWRDTSAIVTSVARTHSRSAPRLRSISAAA